MFRRFSIFDAWANDTRPVLGGNLTLIKGRQAHFVGRLMWSSLTLQGEVNISGLLTLVCPRDLFLKIRRLRKQWDGTDYLGSVYNNSVLVRGASREVDPLRVIRAADE